MSQNSKYVLIIALFLCLASCETMDKPVRKPEIIAEKISSSSAIEENKVYVVEVEYDNQGIWIPKIYPKIAIHHALSLHWENIDDFPELQNPQEGTTKTLVFRVTKIEIEYHSYLMEATRVNVWLDSALCTIIEVE